MLTPGEVDGYVRKAHETVRDGFDANQSEALVIVSTQLDKAHAKINELHAELIALREVADAAATVIRCDETPAAYITAHAALEAALRRAGR